MTRKSVAALAIAITATAAGFISSSAGAQSVDSAKDCDSNAVIRCGISSPDELKSKSGQAGAMAIFNYFGIGNADVDNFSSNAVIGSVTNNGDVIVNAKIVATGAMSAGRQYISGSQTVSSGGQTFFVRPTSVSFAAPKLSAFVVMSGGQFQYAILTSCGNPVAATPVTPSKPKPKAATVKPAKPSSPTANATATATANATATVVNNQAPAAVAQQPAQPQQPQPETTVATAQQQPAAQPSPAQPAVGKTLPNTGPGSTVVTAGVATVLGTVGHMVYTARRGRL